MVAGAERTIVAVKAGAHLYGTATARSDLDIKSVFLPSAREILLQQVRPGISTKRSPKRDHGPSDEDAESHSLQRFFELLMTGHPMAIELLFAPDAFMLIPPDPLWREVQALGPRLVTRRAGVFLRYCHQQAEKFGARAERLTTAKRVLAVLLLREATHGTAARLEQIAPELEALAGSSQHIALIDIAAESGRIVRHFEVCGRKAPFTATIRVAREMTERPLAAYGQRAREAARLDGLDWKALSHAVRIGREAIELFRRVVPHGPTFFPARLSRATARDQAWRSFLWRGDERNRGAARRGWACGGRVDAAGTAGRRSGRSADPAGLPEPGAGISEMTAGPRLSQPWPAGRHPTCRIEGRPITSLGARSLRPGLTRQGL